MAKELGKWVLLEEKPSDYINNGIPKPGEIVELKYDSTTNNATAKRVGSTVEDYKYHRAKKRGLTLFFSSNLD